MRRHHPPPARAFAYHLGCVLSAIFLVMVPAVASAQSLCTYSTGATTSVTGLVDPASGACLAPDSPLRACPPAIATAKCGCATCALPGTCACIDIPCGHGSMNFTTMRCVCNKGWTTKVEAYPCTEFVPPLSGGGTGTTGGGGGAASSSGGSGDGSDGSGSGGNGGSATAGRTLRRPRRVAAGSGGFKDVGSIGLGISDAILVPLLVTAATVIAFHQSITRW
jgi:uncharacterized membrane protein YgcG